MDESYEFTDAYESIDDIATGVIEGCADAQETTVEELENIPVAAVDEVEMDKALKDPDSLTQEEWDSLRARICRVIQARGYHIDGIF